MEKIEWAIMRVQGDKKTRIGTEYTTLNGKAHHAQANAYASGKYFAGTCLQACFIGFIGNNGNKTGFIKA